MQVDPAVKAAFERGRAKGLVKAIDRLKRAAEAGSVTATLHIMQEAARQEERASAEEEPSGAGAVPEECTEHANWLLAFYERVRAVGLRAARAELGEEPTSPPHPRSMVKIVRSSQSVYHASVLRMCFTDEEREDPKRLEALEFFCAERERDD
jgi:hypothetical protein